MADSRINYQVTVGNDPSGTATYDFQVYVPDGFEGKPTDALGILQRAKALLQEEGRWMEGAWFSNEHPDIDPEDAFCNNWGVCMDGALIAVSAGMGRYVTAGGNKGEWQCFDNSVVSARYGEAYTPELRGARRLLVEAGIERYADYVNEQAEYEGYEDAKELLEANAEWFEVPSFNDAVVGTRTEAVAWLDDAIAIGEAEQVVTTNA